MYKLAFELSGDSSNLMDSNIRSLFLEHKYQELIDYYEVNSRYPNKEIIAYSYLQLGMKEKAQSLAKKHILAESLISWVRYFPFLMACDYSICGQENETLTWLEKAIDKNVMIDISNDLFFKPFKNNVRFQKLVEKQKLKKEKLLDLVKQYSFPTIEGL